MAARAVRAPQRMVATKLDARFAHGEHGGDARAWMAKEVVGMSETEVLCERGGSPERVAPRARHSFVRDLRTAAPVLGH